MFKDKNMGSKRPQNFNDSESAVIMDALTGKKYEINVNEEFVIGRAISCAIIIEELFISRRHCVITYNGGKYFIKDNDTQAGTFINCKLLPKGNHYSAILEHGDLISFSDTEKNYIYKFCLLSIPVKKSKLNELVKEEINGQKNKESALQTNNEYFKILSKMSSEILEFRVDHLVIRNEVKFHIGELQSLIDKTVKYFENLNTEVVKINNEQKVIIEDLSKKVSEYEDTLKQQQECLDTKTVENESSLELFKKQINVLIENDCQCPICNEVILKAHTANCHHTFCECCINKWLSLKKYCPVCRSPIKATHNALVMDNFITNLCDLLGGSAKCQRDVLIDERKKFPSLVSPVATGVSRQNSARRGRRAAVPRNFPRVYDNFGTYSLMGLEPVAIVDLTNPTASTSSAP